VATLQAKRQARTLSRTERGKGQRRLISREPIQVRGNRPLPGYHALAKPLRSGSAFVCTRGKRDVVVGSPSLVLLCVHPTGVEPSSIFGSKVCERRGQKHPRLFFDRDATLTVTRTSHPHDLTHNWASIRDGASWDMYTREMCQWPLCTATAYSA
jgi:hypothetical protein